MKNLINTSQVEKAVKVLTVTVLLSLGQESTQRDYEVVFAENEVVDEESEAIKIASMSRKKYTSIIHLGGNATVFSTKLQLVNR